MPLYIHQLFENIVQKTKEMQVNLDVMNCDKEYADHECFGYKKLKPLFFVDDMINFMKLCHLFNMKLQQIVVSNRGEYKFKKSIQLNASFLEQILFGIDEISNSVSLNRMFEEFLIVEPSDSIEEFIEEKQSLFAEKG